MMNIRSTILQISIFFALVGVAWSCVPKDEMKRNIGGAVLELSQETLELTSQKVEPGYLPQIRVKTNQPTVKAVSLDPSWLTAEYRDNGIYITADENTSGIKRETHILVVAGAARELVAVTQSNARLFLDVSPKDIELSPEGESILIDVKSNASDWTFETEEGKEWLTVRQIDNFLQIQAQANKTLRGRVAQIYVTVSGRVVEVNLNQPASNKGARFALPLLERRSTPYEIIAFEEKNGNHLLSYTAGGGLLGQPGSATLKFMYASPVYAHVLYSVNTTSGLVTNVVMTSYEPDILMSSEFMDFLTYKGFAISNNTTDANSQILTFSGINSEAAYGVDLRINKDKTKPSTITLKSRGKQSQPYKTFKDFPFDKSEYLMAGWTYAKIKESELADGSTVDYETPSKKHPKIIRESQYTVDPEKKPLVARIFGMNEDKIDEESGEIADRLEQLVAVFDDLNLGAFVAEGKYHLTEEFQQLLVASGFRYLKETNGLTQWYHDEKKILIIPRGTRFNSVLDLMPVFAISYFYRDLSNQTTAQLNTALDKMSEEVVRYDKLMGSK